ncbi:sulfite exporter TauE/SafE family protein [Conchiformibius kuhniae]|uniref:Probable membrane transporter protein n=1 Tax=Conchiformibius kuhniae TaxID=211502 RepID=A0ABD8B6R8_9NEIS|nr:sulfite exporter TauE/SafE family protein [Conchiformibius kuhniae]
MTDLTLWQYIAVIVLAVGAGVLNIVAGGGSNIILPMLMIFGVPPDIANGSNRVGVFLQSLTGIHGFAKADKIPPALQVWQIMLPTLLGGALGAAAASVLPNHLLKPALLLVMLAVAAMMLFKPNLLHHSPDTEPVNINRHRKAWAGMFCAGIYGGFVQAGVGLLMLPLLVALLRYDPVRANALKVLCTLGFTAVALLIFIVQGQVWWTLGLALAAGNVAGALIGVRVALKLSPDAMRWVVFAMTLVAVTVALFIK